MDNCSNDHDEIVYTARHCPACKLNETIADLNETIEDLKEKLEKAEDS